MDASVSKKRIVILGRGFGAVATARHLEGLLRRRSDVEIVLVSRDNFLLMTPLLFELFSGTLDLRLREARVLAGNIVGALEDRPPQPFVFRTLGMMGCLGHGKGFGQLLKVRVHGLPAWLIRRTYYLLQMPGWGRRLRILIDWTFALLFRADIVKVGLDSETALLLREVALGDAAAGRPEVSDARTHSATDGSPLALARPGRSAAGR